MAAGSGRPATGSACSVSSVCVIIMFRLHQLCKKLPYEHFSVVEKKNIKDCLKVKYSAVFGDVNMNLENI